MDASQSQFFSSCNLPDNQPQQFNLLQPQVINNIPSTIIYNPLSQSHEIQQIQSSLQQQEEDYTSVPLLSPNTQQDFSEQNIIISSPNEITDDEESPLSFLDVFIILF